ncbi:MAG: archaeal proteasome endopeptidase complex subunit beta [Candidatus Altiarchaeales archaeon]|nr:archaeal proteasome endopeptidase complex subunit beta [Candidatus Altiarchaeales archaeon]MBD3417041.1 archaeal proteasome endopeptidase complex subunit beta [Candidatus Altiarchaeales archaeon]
MEAVSLESKVLKGTTTIALTCSDGVVFATDKRASYGGFIASKRARKSFNINDNVGATIAGSVGDAESLMRLIQAESRLYEMNNGEKMGTESVSVLLANILQGNKIFPYLVQVIIGGYSKGESRIFTLDPIGGLIEEKMAATGSGSPMAYGVMELEYKEDKTVEENIPVALKALSAALSRDSHSGDGMELVTITDAGFKKFSEKEVKDLSDKFLGK